ncbi:hypothetical protein SAMN06265348_11736 [Pedobacter westerhofensis]|uniref:Uncharacterized protein n=1 Tax=Pedobacter westerhofensis TaxID=425512 RepID=A0A521FQY2_9SPHI|nr:hypothetical protein [Pedobacter westerhofensis]SMO98635.1 hypothetical protein SAMN06265348_11736 [Pedobacter westerhofensis]
MEIFDAQQIRVAIFKSSNGSGSARIPESDEVSFKLIICVAQHDEIPDSKVFSIGPFLNPRVIKKTDSGNQIILVVEAGLAANRKRTELLVTQKQVKIKQN